MITVRPDGSSVRDVDQTISLLNEQGAKALNQLSLPYSEQLEKLEIIEAYTLKKDGKRIDVPPDKMFLQQSQMSAGAPMFSDMKIRVMVFPDVAAGDKITYKARWTQFRPTFEGNFMYANAFARTFLIDDARMTVIHPRDYPLRIEAHELQGGDMKEEGDRVTRTWTFRNEQVQPPAALAVAPADEGPRIFISSFKSWAAFAQAYQAKVTEKARVTDKVKALADEITMGMTDRREQARALYNWTARQIRYVAVHLGTGTVVPHDVDSVIANRYGDCKDHATLYEALLAAKGIKSTQALINLGTSYKLADVPTLGSLNHVITYIPEFDLYVDSTDPFSAFGALPAEDSDKPVIHTADFKDIRRTPPTGAGNNGVETTVQVSVDGEGNARVASEIVAKGAHAQQLRMLQSRLTPQETDAHVRQALSTVGLTGSGTLTRADPFDLSERYSVKADVQAEGVALMPGPAGLTIPSGYRTGRHLKSISNVVLGAPARQSYPCNGETIVERTSVALPATAKILAIPRGAASQSKRATYESKYVRNGNTVEVTRSYATVPGARNVCSAEDDKDTKQLWRVIARDLQSQIVYE